MYWRPKATTFLHSSSSVQCIVTLPEPGRPYLEAPRMHTSLTITVSSVCSGIQFIFVYFNRTCPVCCRYVLCGCYQHREADHSLRYSRWLAILFGLFGYAYARPPSTLQRTACCGNRATSWANSASSLQINSCDLQRLLMNG